MTRRVSAVVLVSLLALGACSSDDESTPSTPTTPIGGDTVSPETVSPETVSPGTDAPGTEAPGTDAPSTGGDVVAGEPFPADRCEANRAAGTITYLSSFDFAATASIVEVLVAEEKGYFDEMCLDVDITSSFSVANYPQMAAGQAQFSSAGSFSELVDYSIKTEGSFVAVATEGKTGIDALIVKDGQAATLDDLRGATIGVKGAMTTSVKAMLAQAGMVEGTDFTTVLIDGFDPKLHIEIPDIVGFPGYKSNEPLQLEAAGTAFTLFDPAEYEIPGSFGVLYTTAAFMNEHPTAAQDFVRASMKGLADAIADPDGATDIAIGKINANGNAMFLSPEGERARWGVEAGLLVSTNTTTAIGVPEPDLLTNEVTTYAGIGLFEGTAPDPTPFYDVSMISGVYDADQTVVWPGS